jgi:hypothetical protein
MRQARSGRHAHPKDKHASNDPLRACLSDVHEGLSRSAAARHGGQRLTLDLQEPPSKSSRLV